MRCVFYSLWTCALWCAWNATASIAQTATDLSQVRRVFVGSLGEKPGAAGLRSRIVEELKPSSQAMVKRTFAATSA